mgnify:FL=1
MEIDRYKDLVLETYNAVVAPSLWPGVLDQIVEACGARGCIVYEWHVQETERRLRTTVITSDYDPALLDTYMRIFHDWEVKDQDMFECQSLEKDIVELVSELDCYPDQREYLSRPHVRRLMQFDVRHRYASLLDKDNPWRARFSLQRSEAQGHFTAEQRATMRLLLPHVAKSMNLGSQFNDQREEQSAVLNLIEKLSVGVCLLDSMGRIIVKNSLFDQQQDMFRAFRIDPAGRLSMLNAGSNRQFRGLLNDLVAHGRFGARPRKEAMFASSPDQDGQLCIEVVPLDRSDEIGSRPFNGALVVTRDLREPISINLELAKWTFELTTAETDVIDMVCLGLTNSEIAQRRDRSVDTINSQVKTILNKTRSHSRTQLVRTLCNFSSPFTGQGQAA